MKNKRQRFGATHGGKHNRGNGPSFCSTSSPYKKQLREKKEYDWRYWEYQYLQMQEDFENNEEEAIKKAQHYVEFLNRYY